MATDKPFFLSQNQGLSIAGPEHDYLHTAATRAVAHDSATETQYFGFSVPEARIHALCYLWHRPNLGIVTGGAWVWQGFKRTAVHAELCDLRTFMNDAVLANDLHEYRLVNGYGVKVLEPMRRHHMTYADAARGSSIDIVFEAVSPGVMFGDGNHFEQAMRATGELVLRGKRYAIDCYNVRDRSWGKPRPEDSMPVTPPSWMTGVFGPDYSFNCTVFDQVGGNPEIAGTPFALPDEKTLNGGWIWRDGKLGRIVAAKKRVARAPESFIPYAVELEATDEHGRTMHLRGTAVASCPWETWGNVFMSISLVRWENEAGQIAHGDFQEAIWSDYMNFMASR